MTTAPATFDVEVTYNYQALELPSPRHRKLRPVDKTATTTVHVPILTSQDAPVVARINDYRWDKSTDTPELVLYREELRGWNGHLWAQATSDTDHSPITPGSPAFPAEVHDNRWHYGDDHEANEARATSSIRAAVIIDGVVHRRRAEPVFQVQTFGFPGNHGGTSLFIAPRPDADEAITARTWPITAREAAIEGAVRIATERRDTQSVDRLRNDPRQVEVLDPSYFTQPTAEETANLRRAEATELTSRAKDLLGAGVPETDAINEAINLLQQVKDLIWAYNLGR